MSTEGLTPKQKTVFAAMRELQTMAGRMPTLDEIRRHLNYATVSSVQRHVDALKRKGYVQNEKHQSRAMSLSHQHVASIPLVGNVACGAPLLAEENIEAYVAYDATSLHGKATDYFFLRAIGDSMNRAGINDGDLVLVHKADTAEPGKRIVALVGDDATVKKLVQDNGHWILRPESSNPKHKDLIMTEDFAIQGTVYHVVRSGS
jgi:repressor LexA